MNKRIRSNKNDRNNKCTLCPSLSAFWPCHGMILAWCAEACTALHICPSRLYTFAVIYKYCLYLTFCKNPSMISSAKPMPRFVTLWRFLYLANRPFMTWTSWTSAVEWHLLNNRWIRALITSHRVHLGVYLMPVEAEQSRVRTWINLSCTSRESSQNVKWLFSHAINMSTLCHQQWKSSL